MIIVFAVEIDDLVKILHRLSKVRVVRALRDIVFHFKFWPSHRSFFCTIVSILRFLSPRMSPTTSA